MLRKNFPSRKLARRLIAARARLDQIAAKYPEKHMRSPVVQREYELMVARLQVAARPEAAAAHGSAA